MEKKDEVLRVLALSLRNVVGQAVPDYEKLQEIRIRAEAPLIAVYDNHEFFIGVDNKFTNKLQDAYIVRKNEVRETVEYICNYSLYAYEEELRQGFITITGGHRVGLCGRTVCDNDSIRSIKHISFLNIRLSHQVPGCSDRIMPYIRLEDGIAHTLIISPPRCGKTTLLRDIIRNLSNGTTKHPGMTVGVADERSELGASYMGLPQNDLGIRTDVLDCCPKAQGMLMLVRSMSPQVLAVDEIGGRADIEALSYVAGCGCKLIATAHGADLEDIQKKPYMRDMLHRGIWDRFIVLDNNGKVGNIKAVYNKSGMRLDNMKK
ncbi:MAG: stage III sporulation protein AA [Lachnospiraceae bacterium]|nr:stage III sporulation protein AA [Lachnospiraceae bacterium]